MSVSESQITIDFLKKKLNDSLGLERYYPKLLEASDQSYTQLKGALFRQFGDRVKPFFESFDKVRTKVFTHKSPKVALAIMACDDLVDKKDLPVYSSELEILMIVEAEELSEELLRIIRTNKFNSQNLLLSSIKVADQMKSKHMSLSEDDFCSWIRSYDLDIRRLLSQNATCQAIDPYLQECVVMEQGDA